MVQRPPAGSIPEGPGSYQFKSADGRVIRVRLPGDPEPDPDNPEEFDDLDEGQETEAVILVPQHNTMTVEGAVAGIGSMVRTMSKGGAQI